MTRVTELCQQLIRKTSVTPDDGGCIAYLIQILTPLGFKCHELNYGDTKNLYARKGACGRNLCFAGHVDVVPPGDETTWTHPPFSGFNDGTHIWGRGAVDMKGALAAFVAALKNTSTDESISLLITSDEEGAATHGTVKVVEWLEQHNETIDFCLVGEPTSNEDIGDTIKVGRRGSLNATLTVTGQQGHVAYPHLANNPTPLMVQLLNKLHNLQFDTGNEHFQPSNLEITSIDVGNTATNVIPETATAKFNIRFNTEHNENSIIELLERTLNQVVKKTEPIPTLSPLYSLCIHTPISQPFLTQKHPAISLISQAIQKVCGITPQLSTDGGTSDARFIHRIAPTAELGLSRVLAHKSNEKVGIDELKKLQEIYQRFMQLYSA